MGVTATAVIHQPSFGIFLMFDDLLLLCKGGRTAYYGRLAAVQACPTCALHDNQHLYQSFDALHAANCGPGTVWGTAVHIIGLPAVSQRCLGVCRITLRAWGSCFRCMPTLQTCTWTSLRACLRPHTPLGSRAASVLLLTGKGHLLLAL